MHATYQHEHLHTYHRFRNQEKNYKLADSCEKIVAYILATYKLHALSLTYSAHMIEMECR